MNDGIITPKGYRANVGKPKEITLPSGSKIIVKRLSPMDYIEEGLSDIPNDFYKFIVELGAGIAKVDSESDKKNLELFEKYLRITVEKGSVQPPIILKYDPEKKESHLVFAELTIEDQKYIIDVITGKA